MKATSMEDRIKRALEAVVNPGPSSAAEQLEKPRYHPFPARMPVWLAQSLIEALCEPGGTVLDPMVGSGTTAIAALRARCRTVGTDLDPMALLLSRVGTTAFAPERAFEVLAGVGDRACQRINRGLRVHAVRASFDEETQDFLQYWFPPRSQREIFALAAEISALPRGKYQNLAWVVLSNLIIAKSAGASFALDISRSRPHKVEDKRIIWPLEVWSARAESTVRRLPFRATLPAGVSATIRRADARRLPLGSASVDLVITSPPYLNAIDYIRSHKFSLLWMGHSLSRLREIRGRLIGTERGMYSPDSLPTRLERSIVSHIDENARLGQVRRYLSDLRRTLLEVRRVLKPGRVAVLALGPSIITGDEPDAGEVIGNLAEAVGFVKVAAVFRPLEAMRRSLPPPRAVDRTNPLRQRMQGEVFLGLMKPG